MKLVRAHGLGNVYSVLTEGGPLTAEQVRALCDPATGIGGDGILEPVDTEVADAGVRIWNPDGSIAEKSGNGLRIFAAWLARVGQASPMTIWTGFDTVRATVHADVIRVQMGQGTTDPAALPLDSATPIVNTVLPAPAPQVPAVCVSMGNPHCVLFVDDVDAVPWTDWGRVLETHPVFPNRTNVQVATVHSDHIAIRIWERGAGITPASGSSACAVTVAAVLTGRVAPGTHTVRSPGGDLSVSVDVDLNVELAGPVAFVANITMDETFG